jgi:hypothetical protein
MPDMDRRLSRGSIEPLEFSWRGSFEEEKVLNMEENADNGVEEQRLRDCFGRLGLCLRQPSL